MVNGLNRRVQELQRQLQQRDTVELAQNCGLLVGDDQYCLCVWDEMVSIKLPDFIAYCAETNKKLDPLTQALITYYLFTSDGTPIAGEWIAFTELPDGRFYTQAFQGYTGAELAQIFGNDVAWFSQTAVSCGGQAVSFGDAAFRFQALPRVPVLVVCWQGDEDFAPSYKILFDAHISHHLPTDVCAILGNMLCNRLQNVQ